MDKRRAGSGTLRDDINVDFFGCVIKSLRFAESGSVGEDRLPTVGYANDLGLVRWSCLDSIEC
ncbi:hypothetical protein [Chamaesiphon sp. VAR_48_metabat_403]|uniref:hypothetical protein n=1 Tax=Chamaesiphon sp. VAR_48_metabat_403 TaxID=2964700 RepID=UPI00286E9A0B|nr:hypothetical protein [Chamaesiphon sp. VAR_48_metabat_403]